MKSKIKVFSEMLPEPVFLHGGTMLECAYRARVSFYQDDGRFCFSEDTVCPRLFAKDAESDGRALEDWHRQLNNA